MDGARFDELARALARGASRRAVIKTALGAAAAALAAPLIGRRTGARQRTCRNDDDCVFVGELCCSGVCRDVTDDPNHCGDCDAPCPPGPSMICCDGLCADAATSRNHCGRCDNPCGEGEECAGGVCCTPGAECFGSCCAAGEVCLPPGPVEPPGNPTPPPGEESGTPRGVCCPPRQVCDTFCCVQGEECAVANSDLVCCPVARICLVGSESPACCQPDEGCLPPAPPTPTTWEELLAAARAVKEGRGVCCPAQQACGGVCCPSDTRCVPGEGCKPRADEDRGSCVPRGGRRSFRRAPALAQDVPGLTCVTDADCCEAGDVCDNGECRPAEEVDGGVTEADTFGCCKCSGSNKGCLDVQSQAACDTNCGAKIGIFSTNHTCTTGGSGTTAQCRRKTGLAVDEPCEADDAVCSEEGSLTTSPETAAAFDLAERAADGWGLQDATACFDGDACASSGLFGVVAFGETNVPPDLVDVDELISGYRHQIARRTAGQDAPSETIDRLFVRFAQPSAAAEFVDNLRGLLPSDAIDRSDEFPDDDVSFAVTYTERRADDPDTIDERLLVTLKSDTFVAFANYGITDSFDVGAAVPFVNVDLAPPILDIEFLVDSTVFLAGSTVRPDADLAVTVLDGQSLPIEGEAVDQLEFRLLTDVGTIHALRLSQIVDASIGPVSVVRELRELESEEAAISFVADSQGRVQARFGAPLTTFTITEFDAVGDQGTGYIYFLNQPTAGFVGGVTGYARLGTYVGVVNINIRGDVPPTPDQLALIQDGRYFANPGVEIQRAQIERWIGLGASRSIPVPSGLLGP